MRLLKKNMCKVIFNRNRIKKVFILSEPVKLKTI